MKRFHVHISVHNLKESIGFYSALFNTPPTMIKEDYAKWMLDDPMVNFAISDGHATKGIKHLGLQAGSETELQEVYGHIQNTKKDHIEEGNTSCCYAQSIKSWITDPQGVEWEAFYSYGSSPAFGERKHPELVNQTENEKTIREGQPANEGDGVSCDICCSE